MSDGFREFVKKVGSGPHTGKHLTRSEAEAATQMILTQEATPAQIGAFLIAHRIKRPTGEELAGMLDAYDQLGPKLQPIESDFPVLVLGIPYDGRSRTAPISPLTSLILSAAGCPVILHGGDRMPTKYGTPLTEVWQGLGVDWTLLSLGQVQQVLAQTGLGFVYLPRHFPLAQTLVAYRDQIGKRPPFASLELIWSPYAGQTQLVAGFVHPPTEEFFRQALTLRGMSRFTVVKGLEGSCDLPRDRTAIIGSYNLAATPSFERLLLHAHEYGFQGAEIPLTSTAQLVQGMQEVLAGTPSPLMQAAVWNGGFHLWHCGLCPSLTAGLAAAQELLESGQALKQVQAIQQAIAAQISLSLEPIS